MPDYYLMVYCYQLMRALCHLKAHKIMHRGRVYLRMYFFHECHSKTHTQNSPPTPQNTLNKDIKPQNLLVDTARGHVLKLCDFGSAKKVDVKNPSVQYICSRYYRAPELMFGATDYGTPIDLWSSGCVLGELINNGQPIFPGNDGVGQLVEIIKVGSF